MHYMRWERADLVRVSGQSSSVVSQWLGKGSKIIHTIGKVDAAFRIQQASGFHAVWVAEGIGPKFAVPPTAQEQPAGGPYLTRVDVLRRLGTLLGEVSPELRLAVADILSAWAREGGAEDRTSAILALLDASAGKAQAVA